MWVYIPPYILGYGIGRHVAGHETMSQSALGKVSNHPVVSFICCFIYFQKRHQGDVLVSRKKPRLGSAPPGRPKRRTSTNLYRDCRTDSSLRLSKLPMPNQEVELPVNLEATSDPHQPTVTPRPSQFSRLRDDLPFEAINEDVGPDWPMIRSPEEELVNALTSLENQAEEVSQMLDCSDMIHEIERKPNEHEGFPLEANEFQECGKSPHAQRIHGNAIDQLDMLVFKVSFPLHYICF